MALYAYEYGARLERLWIQGIATLGSLLSDLRLSLHRIDQGIEK